MKKQNIEYKEKKALEKAMKREKKKKPPMKVSGKSVKTLAKIIKDSK